MPVTVACGVRARCHRLDRGAIEPASALAATLPLVLRHHAGDVEAPPRGHRARPVRPVRSVLPDLPGPIPRPAAADRAGGRRVLRLRADLPQPGQRDRFLDRVRSPAGDRGRVRAPARRRTAAAAVATAPAAGRLPAVDVPGDDPVRDHRPARHTPALAGHPASRSIRWPAGRQPKVSRLTRKRVHFVQRVAQPLPGRPVRAERPRCSPRRSHPGSRSRPDSRCPSWLRRRWATARTSRWYPRARPSCCRSWS